MADYEINIIGIATEDGVRRLERAIAVRRQDGGSVMRIISPQGQLYSVAELLLMARGMVREERGAALQASVRNLPEMSASRIRIGASLMGNDLEIRLHLQAPGAGHIMDEIGQQELQDDDAARAAELEAEFH